MSEEKTAISVMYGLRQKFARQRGKQISYSAEELHTLFSESMNKITSGDDLVLEDDGVWDEIDEQINKSTIKRYPWKKVFGSSLTKQILTFKKHGFTVDETISAIEKDPAFIKFLEERSHEQDKIIENIKISVNARYGENNTAKKVMGESDVGES